MFRDGPGAGVGSEAGGRKGVCGVPARRTRRFHASSLNGQGLGAKPQLGTSGGNLVQQPRRFGIDGFAAHFSVRRSEGFSHGRRPHVGLEARRGAATIFTTGAGVMRLGGGRWSGGRANSKTRRYRS